MEKWFDTGTQKLMSTKAHRHERRLCRKITVYGTISVNVMQTYMHSFKNVINFLDDPCVRFMCVYAERLSVSIADGNCYDRGGDIPL